MTKAEAVDIILLYVVGGKLSQDANVRRAEINVYLDKALASAIKAGVFEGMVGERQLSASSAILPNYGPMSPIYSPFTGTPEKDTVTGLYKLQLPKVIPLDNDWAVRMAYPEKASNNPYIRMRSPFEMNGAENMMGDKGFYYIEYQNAGPVLWFVNMAMPVCEATVLLAKSVESLGDDELLPYPGDIIMNAIEISKRHFVGQRQMPADDTGNIKDINEQVRHS
jgi:hypothetical protein